MRQPLKDLAAICAGQGAPQGDHNYCENGTPFVKAGNLQELLEGKAITSIQKVSDEVKQNGMAFFIRLKRTGCVDSSNSSCHYNRNFWTHKKSSFRKTQI